MAIFKIKRFNNPQNNQQPQQNNNQQPKQNVQQKNQPAGNQQLTPRELTLENMKMQRQMMINNRTREKMLQQQREAELRQQREAQKMDIKKEREEAKTIANAKKLQQSQSQNPGVSHLGAYKKYTTAVKPVAMK